MDTILIMDMEDTMATILDKHYAEAAPEADADAGYYGYYPHYGYGRYYGHYF